MYKNYYVVFNIEAIREIPSAQRQKIIGSRYTLMYNQFYASQ